MITYLAHVVLLKEGLRLLTLMLPLRHDCVGSINTRRFVALDVLEWLIGSSGSNLVAGCPNERQVSNGIDSSAAAS